MATSNDSTQYVGNYSTTAASNVPPDSGATGKRYQGAAEIRQIKKVLKDSFPSVAGAVTATHTEINQLDGITLDQSVDTTATPDFVGVTAGYFRADQGAPNSADTSTNGYAFGSDGDTGLFAIGSGASSTGLGLYTNNSQRMYVQASNGYVGIGETSPDYKLDVNGSFGFAPGSSVTPADNGDVVFELTNNTTLTIKAKGSDGTVRTATVTLA